MLATAAADHVDDRLVVLTPLTATTPSDLTAAPRRSGEHGETIRNLRRRAGARLREQRVDRDVVALRVTIDVGEDDVVQAPGRDARRLLEAHEGPEPAGLGLQRGRGERPAARDMPPPAGVLVDGDAQGSAGAAAVARPAVDVADEVEAHGRHRARPLGPEAERQRSPSRPADLRVAEGVRLNERTESLSRRRLTRLAGACHLRQARWQRPEHTWPPRHPALPDGSFPAAKRSGRPAHDNQPRRVTQCDPPRPGAGPRQRAARAPRARRPSGG